MNLIAIVLAVITHVTVIDTTGGPLLRDVSVVIRDGRIADVGANIEIPKDAQVIDGRGKFLIPGLWDMHVHLSWTTDSALPLLIANGVTGVRDLGSDLKEIDEWRTKIDCGVLAGPRIYRAGPILNGRSFNKYQLVPGSPEATRGVARALKQVGVDFIKVHRRMERESYFALIDEAKKLDIRVVGHVPMSVSPAEASDAGQATIEHVETLFEGTFSAALKPDDDLPNAIRDWRAANASALFAKFVKNGTVVDPTLVPYRFLDGGDPRMKYVAKSLRKPPVFTADELKQWQRKFAEYKEVVRLMNASGVTLLAGSDIAGPRVPGFTLQDELVLLVESGLTPLQALQAATINASNVLGAGTGVIAKGKLADLVLLDANPLDDIRNAQRINAVIAQGRLYRRTDLDRLLKNGENLAATR
jgi:imidazolonepropionase-like amidohydrolase